VTALATSRPLYGLVSVTHYSAVFLSVGAIILLDLRILGIAASREALAALGEQLRPWTWIGVGTVVVSGFLLFVVDASDFASAPLFRLKLLVTLLALVSSLAVEWNLKKWDQAPATPLDARLIALASIVLWLGAMLLSVEIPAITGLG
jgi:hypothetical protein